MARLKVSVNIQPCCPGRLTGFDTVKRAVKSVGGASVHDTVTLLNTSTISSLLLNSHFTFDLWLTLPLPCFFMFK